mgnify:FL=1
MSGSGRSCLESVVAVFEETSNLKVALKTIQVVGELGHKLSVFVWFDRIEGGELLLRRHDTANLIALPCDPNGSTGLER